MKRKSRANPDLLKAKDCYLTQEERKKSADAYRKFCQKRGVKIDWTGRAKETL